MSVLVSKPVSHLSISTGISNYKKFREKGFVYIDKTMFIARVIENPNEAILIPRPRRFGKTLNMSMLKCFFETKKNENEKNEDVKNKTLSSLFEDTAIWTVKNGAYREHFQQYPVVFLTFKNIKDAKWKGAWILIRKRLRTELKRLRRKYDIFNPSIQDVFESQEVSKLFDDKEDPAIFKNLLEELILALHQITGKKVIILIDEYDAPLLSAHENDYWKEATDFFHPFLSSGFKDQEYLFKGVITGILKIAKESIFSGMNNLDICTILSHEFHTDFGFTKDEVRELTELTNQTQNLSIIKDWYNGYNFGNIRISKSNENKPLGDFATKIYNPWSILKYLKNYLSCKDETAESYWIGTSSNTLIRELLHGQIAKYGEKINSLLSLNLEKNCIVTEINQNLELKLLHEDETALWSLLLFSGYLTVKKREQKGKIILYHLCIPNEEVYRIYVTIFQKFLLKRNSITIDLLTHMLKGKEKSFEEEFNRLLLSNTSFHDFTGRFEAAYHTFVLGIITQLDLTHLVYSNIEAGKGRVDILISPRADNQNGVGVILEFKVLRDPDPTKKKSLKTTPSKTTPSKTTPSKTIEERIQKLLQEGVKQVIEQQYIAFFNNHKVSTVHQYVIVFHNKRCVIQMLDPVR